MEKVLKSSNYQELNMQPFRSRYILEIYLKKLVLSKNQDCVLESDKWFGRNTFFLIYKTNLFEIYAFVLLF